MAEIEEDGSVLVELKEPEVSKPEAKGEEEFDVQKAIDAAKGKTNDQEFQKEKDEEDPIAGLKKQVEGYQARLEQEKKLRQAAEKERDEKGAEALKFASEKQAADHANITNAIAAVTAKQTSLENDYAKAMEEGDYKIAARVQTEIAKAGAYMVQLENGKAALESQIEVNKDRKTELRKPSEAELEEKFLEQYTPRTQEWLRANPIYKDPKKWQRTMALHNVALAEGHEPDTDEYFNFIEGKLGLKKIEDLPERKSEPEIKKPSKPFAAPPTGAASQSGAANPKSVRLTAAEVEAAEMSGISVEEYARNKLALQKSGQLSA
jgi:hypothetical protein